MEKSINDLEVRSAQLERENQALREALQVAHTPKTFDWRSFGVWVLSILSVLALVTAGMLVWLNRTIFDPASYIKTVGPVIEQSSVQKAITTEASSKLFAGINIEQRIADGLPEKAQFLAAPISEQVKTQSTNTIGKVVASDKFHELWVATNKTAQAAFVKAVENGRTDPVIDVNDVYGYVSGQMQDTKLAPLLNKQLPSNIGNIKVAETPTLTMMVHYAGLLDAWRWAFVIGAIVLGALTLAVARNRRKAVIAVGISWMVAAVLSLVVIRVTRGLLIGPMPSGVNRDAAITIWQTVLQYYYVQLAVTFTVGLLATLAGWLLGPGRVASRFRASSLGVLTAGRSRLIKSPGEVPAIGFFQRQRRWFEWGLLAVTLIILAFFMPLTVTTTLLICAVALIALAIVEMLAAPTPG
jgi:hypothetical protein